MTKEKPLYEELKDKFFPKKFWDRLEEAINPTDPAIADIIDYQFEELILEINRRHQKALSELQRELKEKSTQCYKIFGTGNEYFKAVRIEDIDTLFEKIIGNHSQDSSTRKDEESRRNTLSNPDNKNQEEKVSLCPHCLCMTKTINGFCGKCKKLKEKKA